MAEHDNAGRSESTQTKSKPLKAYIVQELDEMTGGVVYAKTNAQARRKGAEEYACGEFHAVQCQRAPEFDGMERDPRGRVRLLLDRGWWFETPDGHVVKDYDEPWVSKSGDVYQSPFHWLREREEKARRERLRKEWERSLWGRWWFAESIHVHIEPRGYADALIRLPYLRDGLHMKERDGKHTVSIRDLPIWQRAYTINGDAELSDN